MVFIQSTGLILGGIILVVAAMQSVAVRIASRGSAMPNEIEDARPCPAEKPPGMTIRVVSANVNRVPLAYGSRPCLLEAAIERMAESADVLLLQEAFAHVVANSVATISAAAAKAGMGHSASPVPNLGSLDMAGSGLMIVSRWPLRDATFHPFETPGLYAEAFAAKGTLTATVLHPEGGRIVVATTHLQATYGNEGPSSSMLDAVKSQRAEVAAAVSMAKSLTCSQGAVLSGDFNHAPSALEARTMWSGAGLQLAGPIGGPPTAWTLVDSNGHHVRSADVPESADPTWRGSSIDRIYISGGRVVTPVDAVRFTVGGESWTDHLTLTTTISF